MNDSDDGPSNLGPNQQFHIINKTSKHIPTKLSRLIFFSTL